MIFSSIERSLAITIFSTLLLTACGGGDSDGSSTASQQSDSSVSDDSVSKSVKPAPDQIQGEGSNSTADNDVQAALTANNVISIARTSCSLGGVSTDSALDKIAIQHANYIKHVFANATPTSFNAHVENKISDIDEVTGNNNPFFAGASLTDRLKNAQYANASYGVTENIAQTLYYSSLGNVAAPQIAASAMTKSLLAAPYHLRSLMLPSSTVIGTGMVGYKPFNKEPSQYQGYVLVTHAAATQETKDTAFKGVFTYPCQDVTDTVTALYNESPDPFRDPNDPNGGTTRDLQKNPIGQPVYINMPTANSIKVSNVKFRDVQRQIDVPVKLLDFGQDPYKNTAYELSANEAFILPLTDNLESCEAGKNRVGNCGLYGNSKYQVSFDVLVDNKNLQSKSFTFSTGKVSY